MTPDASITMFQVRNSSAFESTPAATPLSSRFWRQAVIEETGFAMQSNNQNEIGALEDLQFANPNHQAGRLQEEMVTEISGDRRSRRRYPLSLQLTYKVIRRCQVSQSGSGRTIDLSGNGISFETEEPIEPGATIELSITWPVRLNKTCLLKLIVVGKAVRGGPGWAALCMQSYEFRTKGSGGLQMMSAGASFSS